MQCSYRKGLKISIIIGLYCLKSKSKHYAFPLSRLIFHKVVPQLVIFPTIQLQLGLFPVRPANCSLTLGCICRYMGKDYKSKWEWKVRGEHHPQQWNCYVVRYKGNALPFERARFFGGIENSRGFSLISFILIKLLWPYTPIRIGLDGFDFPRSLSFRL